MRFDNFKSIVEDIAPYLWDIETVWEGKESIQEMKDGGGRNWKQMEWIGFYFEYKVNQLLSKINFSSKENLVKIGKVSFDGFYKIPWDLKAHVANAPSKSNKIIINDRQAVIDALAVHECLGLIVAIGTAVYNDEGGSFKMWHDAVKNDTSAYVREGKLIGRKSRTRKTSYSLDKTAFIKIDKVLVDAAEEFQRDFRNADGSPRNPKIMLDLANLEEGLNVYYLRL